MKSKFGYFMFGAFVIFVVFFFLFFSGVIQAKAQPIKQQYLADKYLTKHQENKSGDWTPYVDNGKDDGNLAVKEGYAKNNQKIAARKSQMNETHAKPVASLKVKARESEYKHGDHDLTAYSTTDENKYGITDKEGDAYYNGDKTDIGYYQNSDDNKDHYVTEYNSKPDTS